MINIYDIENDLLGKTEILVDNNIPKKTNSSEENDSIIDLIIKTSQNILDTLGTGFIEGIYHKALVIDFNKMNYNIETKKIIKIS